MPASMFIYGSILIAVTFKPVFFNNKPVEEAGRIEHIFSLENLYYFDTKRRTNNALSNSTDDTTGNDNVLGHGGKIVEMTAGADARTA